MESFFTHIKKLIPQWILEKVRPPYHFSLAFLAAFFYGLPSRHLTVIGVTGTKGKTTVVEILHEILSDTKGTVIASDLPAEASAQAGAKQSQEIATLAVLARNDGRGPSVASASSLRFRIGDKEARNMKKMTMPGRFFLQKFLHNARRAGCRYVILEVTSEGIKQYRHRFINFSAAVMTNVAPEHIEAHGSFEKYLRAKLDLFWRLPQEGRAIVNRDDPYADRFSAATAARKIWYGKEGIVAGDKRYPLSLSKGLSSESKRYPSTGSGSNVLTPRGIEFDLNGQTISSPLLGEFNFYNILAAAATALSFHVSPEKIAAAVAKVKAIPGRMEFVPAFVKTSAGEQREPFAVVVDYAHTPDSLREVYQTIRNVILSASEESQRSFVPPSAELRMTERVRMICVLGAAGGGRDKWKRPELGKIAAEFCDEIILTNEDPYDENPQDIIDQIESGFSSGSNVKGQMSNVRKIPDRREAIREALKSAQPGDAVIITGKGAEPWMMGPNNTKIPWDDREVVREELVHK